MNNSSYNEVDKIEDLDEINIEEEKEQEASFDLSQAKKSRSKCKSKGPTSRTGSGVSIVNASCGHRVTMSSDVYRRLGQPELVQFQFTSEYLVIGIGLDEDNEEFSVRQASKDKGRGHIYNKALVDEITKEFDLEFNPKTSITFSCINYYEQNDSVFITVKMK